MTRTEAVSLPVLAFAVLVWWFLLAVAVRALWGAGWAIGTAFAERRRRLIREEVVRVLFAAPVHGSGKGGVPWPE